jgi:catabolite repression HPr-like protein
MSHGATKLGSSIAYGKRGKSLMSRRQVTVKLKTGLHARPAALFVQEANKFSSEIFVEKAEKKVNAKSIMGIMSLAISTGTEVYISAVGTDSEEAIQALANLVGKTEIENS